MKIQQYQLDRARTLAQHEMGHYVLATVMGFGTGEVTLELIGHNGHKGGSTIHLAQPTADLDAVSNYLERRVIVLYAGALAETLSPRQTLQRGVDNAKAVEIIHNSILGAEQDHAKAREAITLLRNIQNPDTCDPDEIQRQLSATGNRLWARATKLVEQFEDTIVGVAGALTGTLQVCGVGINQTIIASLSEERLTGIQALQELPRLEP